MVVVLAVILLISLGLIWKGSDWLTDSLIPVAHKIGTSYIAVTTLLASFILSIPEVITSVYSSLLGHATIGIGVLIGSVMANIGLTVGLSASFKPLTVEKSVAIRDGVYLVVAAIIVLLLGADLHYTRIDGLILLALFVPHLFQVWYFEKQRKNKKEKFEKIKKNLSLTKELPYLKIKTSSLTFLLGAATLICGSYLFSYALIGLNNKLSFPELLVGLTIGALGPSLPNIAAAIQGTRKGYKDAAITETFGSNIFTLLITFGVIILLNPLRIEAKIFYFDLIWMIVINLLMVLFIFKGYHYREESLTRYEGAILVVFYLILLIVNIVGF
ncbi:MAG TPA: sodium:calcium antiporter [Candidatus Nanoarchaeia archaeon]|nr:sodium:calcium antiporter [Candidatus Nanoarchaeia archaeon]